MYKRQITDKIHEYSKMFPVITLTGTRQSGKSTLLKATFPDYRYISLEDRDIRDFAQEDPRGFLSEYNSGIIIDEAQRVPDLFSYIQTKVDSEDMAGRYILSGSHNFLLMDNISQSLAGRCAVMKMSPFSMSELTDSHILPENISRQMLMGGYPRLYDKNIEPKDYFPSYVYTYIERDVRSVRNITDSSAFVRFVRLLALHSAQVLNVSRLAMDAGISVPTANSYLSILEQSYVIFFLKPYYRNYSKRLVKSPKVYFYDTGLLCHLLGFESESRLISSELKGAIFETLVISEYIKKCFSECRDASCYYWRDTGGNEIDLLTERGGLLYAYEIKYAETMNRDFMKILLKFGSWSDTPVSRLSCIYRGATQKTGYGTFVNYLDAFC